MNLLINFFKKRMPNVNTAECKITAKPFRSALETSVRVVQKELKKNFSP